MDQRHADSVTRTNPRVDRRSRPGHAGWTCLIYAALAAVGIPWYWPADDARIWLGMPAWVVVAIAASAAASAWTAVLLWRPWPGEEPSSRPTDRPAP